MATTTKTKRKKPHPLQRRRSKEDFEKLEKALREIGGPVSTPDDEPTGDTIDDQFGGISGGGTGARAGGGTMKDSANHNEWRIWLQNQNFPGIRTINANIQHLRGRGWRPADIAILTPECIVHADARGKKRPTSQLEMWGESVETDVEKRSRSLMEEVPRSMDFANDRGKPYEYVIVENVVEVVEKWLRFPQWLLQCQNIGPGYDVDILSINAAFAHTTNDEARAHYRDRMIAVFTQKGMPRPDFEQRVPAFCPCCDQVVEAIQDFRNPSKIVGKWKRDYDFICPVEIRRDRPVRRVLDPYTGRVRDYLDFTLPMTPIGERAERGKVPLVGDTLNRVRAGAAKYLLPLLAEGMPEDPSAAEQDRTFGVPSGGTWRETPWDTERTIPARTTTESDMVVKYRRDASYYAKYRGGGDKDNAQRTDLPISALTANGRHHMFVSPNASFMMRNFSSPAGSAEMSSSMEESSRALTTKGAQTIVSAPRDSSNDLHFVTTYYGNGGSASTSRPSPALRTKDGIALVRLRAERMAEFDAIYAKKKYRPEDVPDELLMSLETRMLSPIEAARLVVPSHYKLAGFGDEIIAGAGDGVPYSITRWVYERIKWAKHSWTRPDDQRALSRVPDMSLGL